MSVDLTCFALLLMFSGFQRIILQLIIIVDRMLVVTQNVNDLINNVNNEDKFD